MKRTILRTSVPVVLFFVFLSIDNPAVFSQQTNKASRPLVILTALSSPQGDTVAGTLASTMTSSIELMLKLTGRVTLRRADFLSPTTSLQRTIPYYDEHNAAEAVYGAVTATANGEYAIDLDVWNASHPKGKPTVVKRTISNVLSSFNLADEMSLTVASTIVGRKLEEGTLVVQNVSSLPKFSIYANGHLLGRNRTSFHILTGNWTIVVAKPGVVGDVPVQIFHVDIKRGTTATIALSQAPSHHSAVVNNAKTLQGAAISGGNEPTPVLTVHAATGSISISTATAGTLYLDGRKMGHIPVGGATLSSVNVGRRRLTMRYADGHVVRKEATVRSGSVTDATFSYLVTPGSRWTDHTLPSSQNWQSVTYGNGTFVAVVRNSSAVATSTDGVNWTEQKMPSSKAWQSITYGNGSFVAVATGSNDVAISNDGVNWIESILPSSQDWQSVAYGNGTFVTVASNSKDVAISHDGVNWTRETLPRTEGWDSVTYGGGSFVAVAFNSSVVAVSSDGVNWTAHSLPGGQEWQSVAYGNGTFVAIAFNSSTVAASSDGVNWTEHSMPSSGAWQSVTYGNGTFVAVASYGNVAATSGDGVSWAEHAMTGSVNWWSVTYGNGTFVAVASQSDLAATSP